MSSTPRLSIAFIQNRPESAARVLSSLPAADAAAFLQELPTRYAMLVIPAMNPKSSAPIIELLGDESGGALIGKLDFAVASRILRQIDVAVRDRFLAVLPQRLRREFARSLEFPLGTVGAQMTTAVAALSANDKTASALELVRQAERGDVDVVFVTGEGRKFVGAVTVTTLLRHPARTPLAELMDTSCVTLSAYARMEAITSLDAWHDYGRLPVVSRRGEVIGAIRRKALRQSEHADGPIAATGAPSMIMAIASALLASVTGLVALFLTTPATAPSGGGRDER